jgi:hypothetical protein
VTGRCSTFLIAHMIYADGLVALFAFGGIYGTGVFGWTITEVGLFGILLTICRDGWCADRWAAGGQGRRQACDPHQPSGADAGQSFGGQPEC